MGNLIISQVLSFKTTQPHENIKNKNSLHYITCAVKDYLLAYYLMQLETY
ncbi:hypothetical protein Xhom_00059 [Xenorhabdus hominickii]|uniref:Uncharacterized protein n=1 Tax=Xenorhabdus hominickii TaxID=351679 RepID=A0A2G0Q8H6_XENHO|nr:hypothetical protein Xhom_02276 [Xenorhabdus hominickii]PHM57105.1 hypothetical protein Xhom_00059 [Xenorhabdus hominickii]